MKKGNKREKTKKVKNKDIKRKAGCNKPQNVLLVCINRQTHNATQTDTTHTHANTDSIKTAPFNLALVRSWAIRRFCNYFHD